MTYAPYTQDPYMRDSSGNPILIPDYPSDEEAVDVLPSLYFNRALTPDETEQVRQYMTAKFGTPEPTPDIVITETDR